MESGREGAVKDSLFIINYHKYALIFYTASHTNSFSGDFSDVYRYMYKCVYLAVVQFAAVVGTTHQTSQTGPLPLQLPAVVG